MQIKKITAIIVSLTMILSVVPAFGITVSADEVMNLFEDSTELTTEESTELTTEEPTEITTTVEVAYTLNEKTVVTKEVGFNPETETGAVVPEFTYSENGKNEIYVVPEMMVSENTTIDLLDYVVANEANENLEDEVFQIGDKVYTYNTKVNLIPNADFTYGYLGWYAVGGEATDENFKIEDGAIIPQKDKGVNDPTTLQRAWDIENGKSYVFTYNQTMEADNKKWQRTVLSNAPDWDKNSNQKGIMGGSTESDVDIVVGTNTVAFTNTENFDYIVFAASFAKGARLSDFALYELKEVTEADNEDITSVDVIYVTKDGREVKRETVSYITANYPEGYSYSASFEYVANGENYLYNTTVEETLGSEDITIEMTAEENANAKTQGEEFISGDAVYAYTTGENLIPNATFTEGLKGWYNGAGTAATAGKFNVNSSAGTITGKDNSAGAQSESALYRAWRVEKGEKYVLTFDASESSKYHVVSMKPDITTTKDGDIVLSKSVDGENFVVFTAMYDYVQINFRWVKDQNFGNFGLYKVEQTGTAVTVTYTVDKVKVGEVSEGFGNLEFGAEFKPYYYSANGSNELYKADGIDEVSEDMTVEMEEEDNFSEYALGDTITIDEEKYVVTGTNLVPNSNFEVGTIGWYSATGGAATSESFTTDAASGTITTADGSLWRAWETTVGRTYILKFTSSEAADNFVVSQKDSIENSDNGNVLGVAAAGENMIAFKADSKYVQILFSEMNGKTVGNFGLYEVLPENNTVTVKYTINGEEVATVTKDYNTNEYPEGYTFEHYHYTENGSNDMYFAEDVTTHYDTTVELEIAENWAGKAEGEYFMHESVEPVVEPEEGATDVEEPTEEATEEIPYQIVSGNMVPNGNFEHKLEGWFNADGTKATGEGDDNGDGTITTATALYRAWAVEANKSYAFVFNTENAADVEVSFGAEIGTGDVVYTGEAGENMYVFHENEAGYIQVEIAANATIGNFGLYEISPATVVTVTYVYDETPNNETDNEKEIIATVTKSYVGTKGAWVDDYYYSKLGSHVMHRVPGQYVTEDTELDIIQLAKSTGVDITRVDNWSHDDFKASSIYTDPDTGKSYYVVSKNLVPNANFEHGLATWYTGALTPATEEYFEVNPENGTVKFLTDGAYNTEGGLFDVWEVEPGATYLAVCNASRDCDTGILTFTNTPGDVNYDESDEDNVVGRLKESDDATAVVTVPEDMHYIQLNIGQYKDGEFGNFGLYKLEEITPIDMEPIKTTVIYGNEPILPEYIVPTEGADLVRVKWNTAELNSLAYGDNIIHGLATDGTEFEAVVEVYPLSHTLEDVESAPNQETKGYDFEKPLTGKFAAEMDIEVHENGDLWLIFNTQNGYFGKDQILIGFYFDGEFRVQDGDGEGGRENKKPTIIANDKPYRVFVKGDCKKDEYSVTITSPEGFTKTVTGNGFRTNADSVTNVAMLANSGPGSYTASNIKIYDPDSLTAEFIKDGEEEKSLGTQEIGDFFYGEEFTVLDEAKFYTSYYDENASEYVTETESETPNHNIAHIVETTIDQTITITPDMTSEVYIPVYVDIYKEHAVLYDTFATKTQSETGVAENLLLVAAKGKTDIADYDADGVLTKTGGSAMGSPRTPLLTFNVPEVNEGEVVKLNLYAYQINGQITKKNMKLAVNTVDTDVDEGKNYLPDEWADTENLIWSDKMIEWTNTNDGGNRYRVSEDTRRITFDVTEAVMVAKAAGKDTITFAIYAPTAGAYVMNREATRYGAVHEGDFAGYLEIGTDTYTITVNGASKVTKDGSEVKCDESGNLTVVADKEASIKLYTDNGSNVAFVGNGEESKIYQIVNETTDEKKTVRRASVNATNVVDDGIYNPVALGADMVDGAQVRIGGGVTETGEVNEGSGLRFVTVVDTNDTLASYAIGDDTMKMGVKVVAEGSDEAVYIPAEKWQSDACVFTTALTNLAVSNYNRRFTAMPYIRCTNADGEDAEFTNASVTRSIYQVAAGLLMKGYDTEGDSNGVETDGKYEDDMGGETDYSEMPKILVDVLNAYVNQTGVRLTLSDSSETATLTARTGDSKGAYTGEAFFEVGNTTYADGKYTVTLKALGESVINVELFNKYVRINNNNTKVARNVEVKDNGDKTYTIVFNYEAMKAPQTQSNN